MRRIVVMAFCAALAGCSSQDLASGAEHNSSTSTMIPSMADLGTTTRGAPTTGVEPAMGTSTTGNALPTPSDTGSDAPVTTETLPSASVGTTTSSDGTTTSAGATTTTGATSTDASTGDDSTGADTESAWAPQGCPAIYAQDILPTFELELDQDVLTAVKKEWKAAVEEDTKKHKLKAFKYQDIVITNASIRLRGNPKHWPDQGKMQFEVEFNTFDPKGRFMGLRHLLFDAATYNKSFLRDRLALSVMRDVGLAAPCANNARLMINGEYYGLFTSIEKVDKEFLERHFEDTHGNLYKRKSDSKPWVKKTNEEDEDTSDLKQLNAAKTVDDLLAVMNLEQALLEWAAEAVIPDRDGLWAGGLNGYVYNDPKTGFNVLPWDLDDSFTRVEPNIDPVTFKKEEDVFHGRPFYDIALDEPVWFKKYVDTIALVFETGYKVDVLQERIDTWAAQIAEAAAADPNKPFTTKEHLEKVKEKREFVAKRAKFLKKWLKCWLEGGTDEDGDWVCDGS